MIKEDNIKQIEAALKLEEGTLLEAVKSDEEVSLEIPELIIRTKEDNETYEKNIKDSEYKAGKTAGEEMLIKSAREKYNLEFEGKTLDNFVEAFKTNVLSEAKIEPSKKIEELTGDINKLRGNISEWETKYNSFVTETTQKETKRQLRGQIMSSIPDNTVIAKDKIALLFENDYNVSIEDGKPVISKNGTVLKNESNLEPLGLKDVVSTFVTTEGFIKKEAGRGGEDKNGNNPQGSYDSFVKEMDKKGIQEGNTEFIKEMQVRINNKTLTM